MDSRRQLGLVNRRCAAALKRTLDEHCHATKDLHSDIAAECGISAGYLSNMATGVAPIPMDVAATIMRVTGRQYLGQEFARLAGAMWIASPSITDEYGDVARVLKEVGEAIEVYGSAMQDGRIDPLERARIVDEIGEAQEALASFMATVERESKEPVTKGAM